MSTKTKEPITWRAINRSCGELAMGLFLLAALNGWHIWPRWFLLSMAWLTIVLGGVSVVAGLLLLIFDDENE